MFSTRTKVSSPTQGFRSRRNGRLSSSSSFAMAIEVEDPRISTTALSCYLPATGCGSDPEGTSFLSTTDSDLFSTSFQRLSMSSSSSSSLLQQQTTEVVVADDSWGFFVTVEEHSTDPIASGQQQQQQQQNQPHRRPNTIFQQLLQKQAAGRLSSSSSLTMGWPNNVPL